jgi:hypothetical protein
LAALAGCDACQDYAQIMGRHDADPADRRRYTGMVLLSVLVLALLVVGVLALTALSHH